MGTKNFLSWLLTLSLIIGLTACESFPVKTRKDQPASPEIEAPDETEDAPAIEKPEFLRKEPPKLGLILGGGGALSFAHIGFLQELENHKIPIHAIAGIEWGALVAAAYAMENKAHAIEWKLLKLPHQKFSDGGFFSSGKSAVKVTSFNEYLGAVFGNNRFADAEIPFSCPVINIGKGKTYRHSQGLLKNAIRSCWTHPPHFKIDNVGADLNAVAELAGFLRKQGAELIIYIDVVSQNELLTKNERSAQSAAALIWLQNKSLVNLLKSPIVDEVVKLSVSGHRINSYKSLRSIIRMGQVKSKTAVKGVSKKYAY